MKGGSSCGVGKKDFLRWIEKPLESHDALEQSAEDEENLCQIQYSWIQDKCGKTGLLVMREVGLV